MQKKQPRGIRNHNWGNIRYNPKTQWYGQNGNDGAFCTFESDVMGMRAMLHLLTRNYAEKLKGKYCLKEVINRWAPPFENNTRSYVERVAASIYQHGYHIESYPAFIKRSLPTAPNDMDLWREICRGMVEVEQSYVPASFDQVFNDAWMILYGKHF